MSTQHPAASVCESAFRDVQVHRLVTPSDPAVSTSVWSSSAPSR
ncbi:hypothetical protein SynA15127_01579 [Synechococcus sp. A15-127]|nr:hypothetical protein SynA15127_01579 [Synechococcus sp. A15-127]